MKESLLYYPILKGKKGEYAALKECTVPIKDSMSPVIELLDYNPVPPSEEKLAKRRKPLRTFADHLASDIKSIIAAWSDANTPIFIDTHLIPDTQLIKAGRITTLFRELHGAGLKAIPVIHPSYSSAVVSEYDNVIKKYGNGYCLRLNADDIDDPGLNSKIASIVSIYGQPPSNIDMLLDNGYILESQVNRTAKLLEATINALPYLMDWRSLILSSAAFPMDLSHQLPSTMDRIPRSDWELFQMLNRLRLNRIPSFSDYAIAHPDIRDIGPIIPNMSASLRYTADTQYIIVKGKGVKHNGYGQTHNLALQIVSIKEYSGAGFSPGDKWIKRCSQKLTSPGNATTWRQAGTSHHLHKVINQLAILSAALKAA